MRSLVFLIASTHASLELKGGILLGPWRVWTKSALMCDPLGAEHECGEARFRCALTQRPDKIAWTTNNPARTRISSLRILNCLKSVNAT